jgi:acyl-CoA thioester hydrolase
MNDSGAEGSATLRVRYSETDQMGVVYHANYLVWCDIGRTELMRELGYPYAELEAAGIKLAVAEATVRYGQPARYDDTIVVRTRLTAAQSRAVTFAYEVYREDAAGLQLLAVASTRLIAIDEGGATRRLPSVMLEKFREFSSAR